MSLLQTLPDWQAQVPNSLWHITGRFEHPQNTVLGQVVAANLELEALAAEPTPGMPADGSGAGKFAPSPSSHHAFSTNRP